ncbi:MAG: orotidine-5'-phosphate decarboxylase [Endozoicomonadaceae bacterium]|nr:orotidine-5'-phosphate decarboxylase [Endozoicomonadaceae bacterium]
MICPKTTCLSPIIVALDFPDVASAIGMANRLDPAMCRVKVGKELFTRAGPAVIDALQSKGFDVFLDLKFHDIPTTTAKAVGVAARMGVWMVNVHALGGRRMMEACREALEQQSLKPLPLLMAVTILTSMSDTDLQEIGFKAGTNEMVQHLTALVANSGMDGVVCSAQEASVLKCSHGADFKLVTPGIRPTHSSADDQCRIVTPLEAIQNGSDYLVIGRPITQADEPLAVLKAVLVSLN